MYMSTCHMEHAVLEGNLVTALSLFFNGFIVNTSNGANMAVVLKMKNGSRKSGMFIYGVSTRFQGPFQKTLSHV